MEKPLVPTVQEQRNWVGGWWAIASLGALGMTKISCH